MDLYLFNLINPVRDSLFFVDSLDLIIFNGVNQFALKWLWLDVLAIILAEFFPYILLFALLLFLLKDHKKYLKVIIEAIAAAFFARFVIVSFIRWILPRARPFVNNNINLLFEYQGCSFPSGQAAFFFAISTILYFYNKKIGALFFLSSILIVLARVFSGIHWPSDILTGAIVGIISGLVIKQGAKLLK